MQDSVCTNTLSIVIVQQSHSCSVQKEKTPLCIVQMHIGNSIMRQLQICASLKDKNCQTYRLYTNTRGLYYQHRIFKVTHLMLAAGT